MIGDRERRTLDDIGVVWFGNGVDLAERMRALADLLDTRPDVGSQHAADEIRQVLTTDYNPLPDRLPQLGDPPTLRPAVPLLPGDVVAYLDRRDNGRQWTVQPGVHLSALTVSMTSPGVDEVAEHQLADRNDLVLVHRPGRHAVDPGA